MTLDFTNPDLRAAYTEFQQFRAAAERVQGDLVPILDALCNTTEALFTYIAECQASTDVMPDYVKKTIAIAEEAAAREGETFRKDGLSASILWLANHCPTPVRRAP